MGSLLCRLASPRVQVPLAATTCLVGLAHILLCALEIREICPTAALLGVVAVAPLAYVATLALFVRSKTPRHAYLWAVFAPIAVAILVGDGVIAYTVLVAKRGLAAFGSLVPTPFAELIWVGTATAAGIGTLGSLVLSLEVWAASGALRANPRRGAHHFAAVTWVFAAGMWALAFGVAAASDRSAAIAMISVCAVQLLAQWLAHRALVAAASPASGPYRTGARMPS
jgi:hypothetical protein